MPSLDKIRALSASIRQITLTYSLETHIDNTIFIGLLYNPYKKTYWVVYDTRLENEYHVKAALLDLIVDYNKQFNLAGDLFVTSQEDFKIPETELSKSYFKQNTKAYPVDRLEMNFQKKLETYKKEIHPNMEGY